MVCGLNQGDALPILNPRDFAQQLAVSLVHDHETILARDEDPVMRRIGRDVVPASVATQDIGVRDVIRLGILHHRECKEQGDSQHVASQRVHFRFRPTCIVCSMAAKRGSARNASSCGSKKSSGRKMSRTMIALSRYAKPRVRLPCPIYARASANGPTRPLANRRVSSAV